MKMVVSEELRSGSSRVFPYDDGGLVCDEFDESGEWFFGGGKVEDCGRGGEGMRTSEGGDAIKQINRMIFQARRRVNL